MNSIEAKDIVEKLLKVSIMGRKEGAQPLTEAPWNAPRAFWRDQL
jgi:hypothetical protein